MYGSDRRSLRQFFLATFARERAGETLEPMQSLVAGIIRMHPEYHALLADPESVERDDFPGAGDTNPFLHMAMHVAIAEQVAVDRPAGVRDLYLQLRERLPDNHAVEHAVMECLGRIMWQAQHDGRAPDEQAYLACLARLAGGAGAT